MDTIHDLTARVRADYIEMPGLRLTIDQVRRLCGLERPICEQVLGALIGANFLCLTHDGRYARVTDASTPRPRAVKARLPSITVRRAS